MKQKGYIHIYTGNGKGKTTASLGLALRAKSNNLKVCYISFHKHSRPEFKLLKKIGIDFHQFAPDTLLFNKKLKLQDIRIECLKGLKFIDKVFHDNKYDILILDEINISTCEKYVFEDELLNLIKCKPANMELILTGRNASKKLINMADLVTEMNEVKHYFSKGVSARKGIEK